MRGREGLGKGKGRGEVRGRKGDGNGKGSEGKGRRDNQTKETKKDPGRKHYNPTRGSFVDPLVKVSLVSPFLSTLSLMVLSSPPNLLRTFSLDSLRHG